MTYIGVPSIAEVHLDSPNAIEQPAHQEWFAKVAKHTGHLAQGGDIFIGGVSREDHGGIALRANFFLQAIQQAIGTTPRHVHRGDNDCRGFVSNDRQALDAAGRREHSVAALTQIGFVQAGKFWIVVGNQNRRLHHRCPFSEVTAYGPTASCPTRMNSPGRFVELRLHDAIRVTGAGAALHSSTGNRKTRGRGTLLENILNGLDSESVMSGGPDNVVEFEGSLADLIEDPESFEITTREEGKDRGYLFRNRCIIRCAADGVTFRVLTSLFGLPDGEEIKIEKDYSRDLTDPQMELRLQHNPSGEGQRLPSLQYLGTHSEMKRRVGVVRVRQ